MKASVVIAAFNEERFICHAVRSALGQTLRDIEVIVVNDGSTDRTANHVELERQADARVVLIDNPTNQGVSACRNQAMKAAKGDWIAVLDADDSFAPDRLDRLVAHAEARGLDLLADNLKIVGFPDREYIADAFPSEWVDDDKLLTLRDLEERDGPQYNYKKNFGFAKPIIRRAFLERNNIRYNTNVRYGEDWLLYVECVARGAKFAMYGDALYEYTVRPDSVSWNQEIHRHLAKVNRLAIGIALANRSPDLRALLRRQKWVDFQAFKLALKNRRYKEALLCARHVAPFFALRRCADIAIQRAGGRKA